LKVEEKPSQPCYILTEPGVGYVFQAQIHTLQHGEAQWSEASGKHSNASSTETIAEAPSLVSAPWLETETS
jgi:DNA-binding winged helix-turn-helix (wHTH) protein